MTLSEFHMYVVQCIFIFIQYFYDYCAMDIPLKVLSIVDLISLRLVRTMSCYCAFVYYIIHI